MEKVDGAMAGFCALDVVVIDSEGKVNDTELVPVIGQEPDYDSALKAIVHKVTLSLVVS